MVKLKLQCKSHPGYTAKISPRLKCRGCQTLRLFMVALNAGVECQGIGGYKYDAIGALDLAHVDVRRSA